MPKRSVPAGAGGGGGAHPRPPGHQAQHARVLAPAESPGQAVGLLPGDTQILFSSVTGGQRRCDYSRAQQLELLSRAMSSWAGGVYIEINLIPLLPNLFSVWVYRARGPEGEGGAPAAC